MRWCLLASMLLVLVASSLGCSGPDKASAVEAARGDPVLVGAGDIASCGESGDEKTARLLDDIAGTVFTAGDNAYEFGRAIEYRRCYGPTWGRHKERTRPAPGNHDHRSSGASPYYEYFGQNAGPAGRGYYSYDLGAWHAISLNSNVAAEEGSPQFEWLRADLGANTSACSVAYWHQAVFSSGEHGSNPHMARIWKLLDESGVDVVVVGHDHDYERFAPQDHTGKADPSGIRQFIVGTGGRSLHGRGTEQANSEAFNDTTLGVLELTLHSGGYDWAFVPAAGGDFTDAGSGACH